MPPDILDSLASTSAAPTIADHKAKFAAGFEKATVAYLDQVIRGHKALHGWLWHTDDLTPAQKVAALGTRAASMFRRAAALKAFIESQLATIAGLTDEQKTLPTVPAMYVVTLNDDGSAVLSDAK